MPNDTALHAAAKAGDLAQVLSQLRYFDVNTRDDDGETALCTAAGEGHTEVVKLLLTNNADVNIPNVSTLLKRYLSVYNVFFLHI